MTLLSTDAAIQRFQENEERVDKFVNQNGTYVTNTAQVVETLPSFMARLISRYLALQAKGDWATSTNYVVEDLVKSGTDVYICTADHTSGTFATDVAAGKWALFRGVTALELENGFSGPINTERFIGGTQAGMSHTMASFQAHQQITAHAWYAFLDSSVMDYTGNVQPIVGHASFNDNVTIQGNKDFDHHHSYQAYPHYYASGTLSRMSCYWALPDVTNGTIGELSIFKAGNPVGSGGTINNLYGLYVEPLGRATDNWAVYTAGATKSRFGGDVQSLSRFLAIKDGGVNPSEGAAFSLQNAALDRAWYVQLNADNDIDFHVYKGTAWQLPLTITNTRLKVNANEFSLGGALFTNNGANTISLANYKFTNHTTEGLFAYTASNGHATSPVGIRSYFTTDINSSAGEFLRCDAAASVPRAIIYGHGGLTNYSANNTNLSDRRLKKDFKPAKSYYDAFKKIEFQTFLYKDQDDETPNLGVVAQQLESVCPELVCNDGFGETPKGEEPYKSVYQTDFQFAMAKALQEAILKIDELTKEVEKLKAK